MVLVFFSCYNPATVIEVFDILDVLNFGDTLQITIYFKQSNFIGIDEAIWEDTECNPHWKLLIPFTIVNMPSNKIKIPARNPLRWLANNSKSNIQLSQSAKWCALLEEKDKRKNYNYKSKIKNVRFQDSVIYFVKLLAMKVRRMQMLHSIRSVKCIDLLKNKRSSKFLKNFY